MYILSIFSFSLMGILLGLLGGGGSIIATPILLYFVKLSPKIAIASSLVIVATTSLIGAYAHWKKGRVKFKPVIYFVFASMIGSFMGTQLTRWISESMQVNLFIGVVLIASYFMLKKKEQSTKLLSENEQISEHEKFGKKNVILILSGFFVGIITGVVGVGGGFIIVPALVLFAKLEMPEAVGTSLTIICINSLIGFLGYVSQINIPWNILSVFIVISSVGVIIGTRLSSQIPILLLRKGFAILLICVGIGMALQKGISLI